jgi:tetratricopeptide (TPR) repeat protein
MNVTSQFSSYIATIFNNFAMTHERSGDGHTALDYYVEALKIFSLIGNLDHKAVVLNNIGTLLTNHGSYSDALDCFHEVSEIMRENGNRVGEAAALCNICTIYMNLGDFETMLKVARQSLGLIHNVDHPTQESLCRSGIAAALYGMGKTVEAIPYLQQSISLLKSRDLLCDASGTSIDRLEEVLHIMQIGEPSKIFDSIELSNALKAFITAASWEESLHIFEQHKALLSLPEVEENIEEGIFQMRISGEMQKLSNLQAHLKLLRRAKRYMYRMGNLEIPKNTSIRLVEEFPSLDFDYMIIPIGTLGTIEEVERHPGTNEIIGYYATIHALSEEYLFLDPWDFEVVDLWEEGFYDFNLDLDDMDSE